ncbi:MAG: cupin domain-containing protein [Comamonadaceae bacterium]|nr:MAG: cupin domain-containing protein [Comamonadaceae bacterium]
MPTSPSFRRFLLTSSVVALAALPATGPCLAQAQGPAEAAATSRRDHDGSIAAPGRGYLPESKDSIKTTPLLFDFEAMAFMPFIYEGKVLRGVRRKFGVGASFRNTWWELKKGAVLPLHSHQIEQITHVLKGRASLYSQERKYDLTPGKYAFLLPNTPHELVAEEDTVVEDIQSGDVGNYTGGLR